MLSADAVLRAKGAAVNDPQDMEQTLADEEIETRRRDSATGTWTADTGDDSGDTSDTGDDSGDPSDVSDTGDDTGDTGDDSGDSGDDSGS
jgi:hypothetical protein